MERMFLIGEHELFDLLTAWYKLYCLENWADKKGFFLEWCEENHVQYNENFSFEDIAEYEMKYYEETELTGET